MTPNTIRFNLEQVRKRISLACLHANRPVEEVILIAVSKTVSASIIQTAYDLGVRDFGESRLQEAGSKVAALAHLQPRPTWHMIGRLQSNKINAALESFDIIHSIDSVELAEAVNKRANRKIPVLLQVNVAAEASKSGFSLSTINVAFQSISQMPNLNIRGLMTIAPLVDNPEEVRPVFRQLRNLRDSLNLEHLSMGMTHDFEVAIEEGATMVRIGRAIFGER